MLRVTGETLRSSARSILWWSVGLAGMVAALVAVYPALRDNPSLKKLTQQYPEALKGFIAFGGEIDYTSAAGYLGSELFSLMVPLLLLLAAVGAGARAIAGEEEAGTLELLVTLPVSRTRVVVEKIAALIAELSLLGLVLWISLAIGAWATGMDISVLNLGAATASAVLFAVAYGLIALLVGAATGRRGWSVAVAAAGAAAAYLLNALAPLVDSLEPLRRLSPFYHYIASDPLRHGLAARHVAGLAVIALVCAVLAPFAFARRDIGH
jgi:beta-exotoxin I transport system permease protein